MGDGKKARDFLQFLDNHVFFNDLSNETLQYFFTALVKKDLEHGYDDNENLVDEKLLKKKMFEYLLNDTKLLMENIPKVQLIIVMDKELSDEEKSTLKDDLQKKIKESNERIKDSNIGDIINKQFDIFTN
tara:strand:- start:1243 stop:1632 length:390 start_codon:yes stop_codon:yes gene_type:complete